MEFDIDPGGSYVRQQAHKGKTWDDLGFANKADLYINSFLNSTDAQTYKTLNRDKSKDAATSTVGGQITGQESFLSDAMNQSSGDGSSLGRPVATENEQALQQENYNNNNFSF